MPNLKKLLCKFDEEERRIIELLIEKIISLDWEDLNIKKLRGYQDIFRVRKGKIRIIFSKDKKEICIISIERRCENTYKF
jgi:mRNA-degrading endonuclease RelE of RelBE toxin-antitoxin system